jgi:serine/threonine-protein kinase
MRTGTTHGMSVSITRKRSRTARIVPTRHRFIDRWRLLALAGVGGGSRVWCAFDLARDDLVAIKTSHRSASAAALRREATILARLQHPNVVGLAGFGTVDAASARRWPDALTEGAPFIVLPFAAGGSLQRLRGALAWPDVRAVMKQLLAAVAHLHDAGLRHGDIKPANVLVTSRQPLAVALADLELATSLSHAHARIGGTPPYMAPELDGSGGPLGPWTDLYACGRVASELVEGPLAPMAVRWLARLLAPRPVDRFPSVAAAVADLERTDGNPWPEPAVAA